MQIHMLKICKKRKLEREREGGGQRERKRRYHVKTACQKISRMLINDQFWEEAESIYTSNYFCLLGFISIT